MEITQAQDESTDQDESDNDSVGDESTSDEEILRLARERFLLAQEAEADIRKEALDDLEFRAGRQWPDDIKMQRVIDNRPCLVINRIPQFIRQITNDQRKNRPSIKVSPIDDKADVETAKILQGMIRHIEYNSSAELAYDTAFEGAVTKSFGFFRIITDYIDPMSFDQEILIKRIRNSFSVYMDVNSKEPDCSDANWGFIFEDIPNDEYKADYGDSKLASSNEWRSIGDQTPGWVQESTVRVAEYFYKEYKTITLALLSNGFTADKAKLTPEVLKEVQIVRERKAKIPVVKWCKINGHEILEKTDWLGKWIPIIPVVGDELDINGKRVLEGIVRHAKDPQRMYNYWASTETETIALAPKAPWIVAEGQVPPEYQAQWANANSKNHAYLPYKTTSVNGQLAPPPQRNVFEPPVQAISQARGLAADDMKATTGIYDASLGNQSNEQSGIAITRRNQQSETSNFHFIDNLSRALRHAGRILVDLIPKVYDTQRSVRILGENGDEEVVAINQMFDKDGKNKIHNLQAGLYDVTVETGPSYSTKRQEAVASMIDLTKVYPQVAQVAGDLMVRNMDWSGAQEIADRLKKTLPPGIADEPDKKQPPIPPQVQAQMQQMGQLIDKLTTELTQSTEAIKNKTYELQSKERIEMAKLDVELRRTMMIIQGKSAQTVFESEIEQLENRLQLLGVNQPMVEPPQQNPTLNGPGPQPAAAPNVQQPTGGMPG